MFCQAPSASSPDTPHGYFSFYLISPAYFSYSSRLPRTRYGRKAFQNTSKPTTSHSKPGGTPPSKLKPTQPMKRRRTISYLLVWPDTLNFPVDVRSSLMDPATNSLAKQLTLQARELFGGAHRVAFGLGESHTTTAFYACMSSFFPSSFNTSIPLQSGRPPRNIIYDGFRCLLTASFDKTSMKKSPELAQKCRDQNSASATYLCLSHSSESMMRGINPVGTARVLWRRTRCALSLQT